MGVRSGGYCSWELVNPSVRRKVAGVAYEVAGVAVGAAVRRQKLSKRAAICQRGPV
ncbi:MAG: hypothetical protein PT944_06230 [Actinomycetaceae bacterium]|nr:hypothetical protein [Arcanobacterium sp.]MDD7687493.1 hypothetical protein [Actinomycetaceae bacterium]MDY5272968.1 hypothetical protein [Arcanobacterium sp.]